MRVQRIVRLAAMQLIQQWPDALRARHDAISVDGWQRFAVGDFEGAARAFESAYRLVLGEQPEGQRYHKGEALHNRGVALLWGGDRQRGLEETLAGFIEDAASLAEENPRFEELDRPAAHNLIYVFGLAGPPLAAFALQVRSEIGSGRLLPDPHALLATPAATEAATPPTGAPVPRTIGTLDSLPERRVFIGGWYGRLVDTLRPLADYLVTIGYDGLMAADFGVPSGWGEDEVMFPLLTSAQRAIFEVSESAGQVEEIADVPETMRTPQRILAVFDRANAPKPGISRGQTLAKLERWKVEPLGYGDLEELKRIVRGWLPP